MVAAIQEPVLLKINDAAALASVGRSTIYELINAGELPTVRIGRAVRIPTRAIREWVERMEREQVTAGNRVAQSRTL